MTVAAEHNSTKLKIEDLKGLFRENYKEYQKLEGRRLADVLFCRPKGFKDLTSLLEQTEGGRELNDVDLRTQLLNILKSLIDEYDQAKNRSETYEDLWGFGTIIFAVLAITLTFFSHLLLPLRFR